MKVTIEQIADKIKSETYLVLPDGRTTICTITLKNGYTVHGYSACVDHNEFDLNLGRKYAHEDAVRQIWPLEGYLLAQFIYENTQAAIRAEEPQEEWSASVVEKKAVVKEQKKRTARVRKLLDATAPYGYKKDGTIKKAPGRPRKEQA